MATRLEIIEGARIRANMDGGQFPSTAAGILIAQRTASSLWSQMLGWDLPVKRKTVSVAATGGPSYPLGVSDVYRIDLVWHRQVGSLRYSRVVHAANVIDQQFASGSAGLLTDLRHTVSLDPATGWELSLFPVGATGDVVVEYTPVFAGLPLDASIWFGPPPSDELLELRIAIKLLRKEDPEAGKNLFLESQPLERDLESVVRTMVPPAQVPDWASFIEGSYRNVDSYSPTVRNIL